MMILPSSESPAKARSISSSSATSTNSDMAGEKGKLAWSEGLSAQPNSRPHSTNEASLTVPSAPGPSLV